MRQFEVVKFSPVWLVVTMLAALLTQGCGTTKVGYPVTPPGQPPRPDHIDPSAGEEIVRQLNVSVTAAEPADPASRKAVDLVRRKVEGGLVAAGFRVDSSRPDITADVQVSVTLFDQSGSYHLYDGKSVIAVRRAHDKRLLGQKDVTARGERQLGQDPAIVSVSDKLAAESAAWVQSVITPEQTGLAAVDIQVSPAWLTLDRDAQYAQLFIDKVSAQPGVVSCTLIEQTKSPRVMVFRVVFNKQQFKAGIMNRILTIPELNLKRK